MDWSLFTDEKLEQILLGVVYRTRHSQGYRRAPDERVTDVDPITGLARSEAMLLPVGHAQWISGVEVAMRSPIFPDKLATACLGLYWKPRVRKMTDDEYTAWTRQAEADAARDFARLSRGESVATVQAQEGPNLTNWTAEELLCHSELVYRWKKLLMRWKEKGWAEIRPPVVYSDEFASGYGQDGMPRVARITAKAVDAAEEQIRGTRQAKGAYSSLACAPADVISHALRECPWAVRMSREEVAGV
jgi:hypothetical protein